MEIERKYLIHRLPDDLESYPHKKIQQAYLCTNPVVRIRRQDTDYFLTYKGGGLMVREEYNLPLPRGPMVVEEVSFTIDRGETLAIFGDSGSGKSTIGQILAGIYPATAGEVRLDGQRLSYPLRGPARRRIQILFQHPEVAFNPKLRLIDSMREPYRLFHLPYTRQGLCDYLERYGIYEEHLDRFPAELSGGELQRLALARAMLMDPSFLVLDEPTSMLDVISQAQMIHLLQEIQQEREVGYSSESLPAWSRRVSSSG